MQLTLNDASWYVEEWGMGEPQVLMLHGWGCDHTFFRPVAQELSRDRRVLVPDFPAHGSSEKPPRPWNVGDFEQGVAELIRTQMHAPVDIVAHSFGVRVAIKLSAEHPDLVHRMVLTGAAGIRKPLTDEQKKKSEAFQRKKRFYDRLASVPFLSKPAAHYKEALIQRHGSPDYLALDEEMRKTFVKVINEDLTELLPAIQASTLLVFGEQDTETPLWMGQKMEALIPDAGLVVFENDDHFAFLHQWERFNTIVRTFFQ